MDIVPSKTDTVKSVIIVTGTVSLSSHLYESDLKKYHV